MLTKADKSTTYSKTETDQRIKAVIGAAPEALDTLKEIGDALNNDPDFAGTMTTQLAGKVDKVSGKQLSTENFSSEEKAKLAGLTTGAGGAGSATDIVIGDRTITDTQAPTGNTGSPTKLWGWLAWMIRAITGKGEWYTPPATTLEKAKEHADDTTRHISSAERTAWNNKETTAGAQAKADAVQTNLTTHAGNTTAHITAAERTAWSAKVSKAQSLPSNADLNTFLNEGSWVAISNAIAATITNRPFGDYAFNLTIKTTVGADGTGCNQTITFYRTDLDPPKMYTRNFYAGVWSAWVIIETAVGSQSKADAAQAAAIAYTDTKVGRVDLTQTLGPGTSVVTADGNGSELELTVQGRTLVNLLGSIGNFEIDSDGDGRADGLSIGMPATYSRVVGKYGAFAQRIANSASETSTDRRVSRLNIVVPAGKYVVIADGMTDGTNGRMGISVYNNGSTVGVTTAMSNPSNWKPVYTKYTLAADTTTLALHFYNTATAGTVGWAQYDGAGLYQVDDALYARIGADITEANIRDYLPHVDGKQHVQGVAVSKQGRNLYTGGGYSLGNGAGTTMNEDLATSSITVTSGAVVYSYMRSKPYAVFPNTTYTLSYVATNVSGVDAPQLSVRKGSDNGSSGIAAAVGGGSGFKSVSFDTGTETEILLFAYGSVATAAAQVKRYDNIQLELGGTATTYTPAEPQSVILPVTLGQIGDVRDSVYSQGTEWKYLERVKKNVLLDGSLSWVGHTSTTDYSVIRIDRLPALSDNSPLGGMIVARMVKYTGSLLINSPQNVTATAPDVFRQLGGDAYLYLNVARAESGWVSALPQALMQ